MGLREQLEHIQWKAVLQEQGAGSLLHGPVRGEHGALNMWGEPLIQLFPSNCYPDCSQGYQSQKQVVHIPIREELGLSRQEHRSFQTWDGLLGSKGQGWSSGNWASTQTWLGLPLLLPCWWPDASQCSFDEHFSSAPGPGDTK